MGNSVGRERSYSNPGNGVGGSGGSAGAGRPFVVPASGSSRHRHHHGIVIGDGERPSGNAFTRHEQRYRDREAREAAKAEKERLAAIEREKERERSMREENVDGGFLVTQGVYTGAEDFKHKIVRQLMIERRLAPFFKGLSDHEDDWTDEELIAAVKAELGENDPEENEKKGKGKESTATSPSSSTPNIDHLTVPIASRSRSHSYTSDTSSTSANSHRASSNNPAARLRSKTLSNSPKVSSIAIPTQQLAPGEAVIPGRQVDGRHVWAVLYKDALECPICFLYYPPYLNKTRCCDQEICSECFVQIKRADPHLPDHHQEPSTSSNPASAPAAQSTTGTTGNAELLTSEPASCPFCKETDFGVTYTPPPFRLGLVLQSQQNSPPATTSSSPASPSTPNVRRHHHLPHNAPQVVTTDQIRPDWSQKLAHARAQAARRAAAATALHTAAFLMNSTASSSSNPLTGLTSSSRRMLRRVDPATGASSPSAPNSGSGTPQNGGRSSPNPRPGQSQELLSTAGLQLLGINQPRSSSAGSGSNQAQQVVRARMEDLEEMMIMEAIRLSLAEEEERKKREAKEQQKKDGSGSSGDGAGGEGSAANATSSGETVGSSG
ncbi:hypothetical protein BJ508DRAFT_330026 [Ascobolus immersus RN42]|uniref:Uncharacterized protein n=1 Tax=Ascobolus immersus RN42 TaxID=1160509 RepID=A0A3N4I779_ASCIM|nr:hypothetical protein BJ508DRAFT_330026 [Ascobolus immersus RN42]